MTVRIDLNKFNSCVLTEGGSPNPWAGAFVLHPTVKNYDTYYQFNFHKKIKDVLKSQLIFCLELIWKTAKNFSLYTFNYKWEFS